MKKFKFTIEQIVLLFAAIVLMLLVHTQGVKNEAYYNAIRAEKDAANAEALAAAKDGTYIGEATGFGGPITAEVTFEGGKIVDIKVTGDSETQGLGSVAVEKMPPLMLENQTIYVDGVSGATISSKGVREAVIGALAAAGVDVSKLTEVQKDETPKVLTPVSKDVDIVIVGAGGAGMTAAITATQEGKSVVIVEKMPYVGGNTLKATGGMNAAETKAQKDGGIPDSVDQFVEDTMKGGHYINNEALVRTMCENSNAALEWLESIGASLPKLSFSGGATYSRIHSPADGSGVGEYLVHSYSKTLEDMGIEVLFETKATAILMEGGQAVGIEAEGAEYLYTINAKAVILATGGFGSSEEMIVKYRPDLKGTVSTNAPGATGDGIVMAEAVGAATVDLDQIQLHPTVEQETKMLITEGVRGDGAILVNQSGKRFTNELLTRDAVSAAELQQEGCYAYVIFDQELRSGLKAIEKYVKSGIVVEAATIEELGEKLGMDGSVLAQTLATWNQAVANQKDEEFGRTTGMEHDLSVAPYYAIKIAPGIHHTMGGIEINTNAEVVDVNGNVIPGLFAAGEVTGGVQGGNRLGGNAVTDIVVFGRISAANACKFVDNVK